MLRHIIAPRVHRGIALISWATAVRWIGWGVFEPLLPIFFFSFVGSYAETGILQSTYSIVFLAAAPLIGVAANRLRAKSIILSALYLYPLIGLAYYLAGAWGMVIFIVLARALNGITYALDNVGRTTYLRRHANKEFVGSSFGYMRTVMNLLWIGAMLASVVLIKYFKIHELALLIIPTTLIAIFMISKLPKDRLDNTSHHWKKYISLRAYKEFIQEIMVWNSELKRLAVLTFFVGVVLAVVSYFMPVYLFTEGVSIQNIIIFNLIFTVPTAFSAALGWLADRLPRSYVTTAFILLGLLLLGFAFANSFSLSLVLVFFVSMIATFLAIFVDAEMTRRGDRRAYGSMTSAAMEVGEIATIIGPIVFGLIIDRFSIRVAFVLLALIFLALSVFARPLHHALARRPSSAASQT